MNGFERITIESKDITGKSNGIIDMQITGNYAHITSDLFQRLTDVPTQYKIR